VTVTSGSADIDASSVVVTAQHGSEAVHVLSGTPTTCGGNYCRVFRLDLSQVQMNAAVDTITVSATASDTYGNAMVTSEQGAVRVTRWQWARRASATEALRASPAINRDGVVYLGLAGTSTGGLVAVSPDGTVGASTGDGPVTGSPAIGRNAATAEYVYYALAAGGGELKAIGLAQTCTTSGTTTPGASLAIQYDSTDAVMGVGILADDKLSDGGQNGSRVVGLQGDWCRGSGAGLATVAFPGNLVATGDSVFWGDSDGQLHTAAYSTASSNFVVASAYQTPSNVGVMNGLALFSSTTGTKIGGGGPGIGKLFAYPVSLEASDWGVPGYDSTPTSGPVVTAGGVVAAARVASKVQALRVSHSTGAREALTGFSSELSFSGTQAPTPVAGTGGLLYFVDEKGRLAVLPQSFVDSTAPNWSTALPTSVAGTTSASPTIDCNRRKPSTNTGILYLATETGWLVSYIVDSKGLDTTAPWPKYGHDVRNTNNPATPIEECP